MGPSLFCEYNKAVLKTRVNGHSLRTRFIILWNVAGAFFNANAWRWAGRYQISIWTWSCFCSVQLLVFESASKLDPALWNGSNQLYHLKFPLCCEPERNSVSSFDTEGGSQCKVAVFHALLSTLQLKMPRLTCERSPTVRHPKVLLPNNISK